MSSVALSSDLTVIELYFFSASKVDSKRLTIARKFVVSNNADSNSTLDRAVIRLQRTFENRVKEEGSRFALFVVAVDLAGDRETASVGVFTYEEARILREIWQPVSTVLGGGKDWKPKSTDRIVHTCPDIDVLNRIEALEIASCVSLDVQFPAGNVGLGTFVGVRSEEGV